MLGQHTDLPLRNDGRAGRRSLLQIRLTPEVLQQILAQQGKGLQLDFDDKALLLGESKFPFSMAPESAALDVYRCPRTTQEHLDLVGRVSHKVTVRRELANAITDKLKTRNAEAKAAKEGRSVQQIEVASMHGTRNGPAKTIRPAASAVLSKGRQSPFLQARKSPLLVASSPKPGAVPLNTKLIQVLAAGASTIEELGGKLRASPDALQPLLQQVGRVHAGEWVLKDDMYAQVKVWDWRHYTTSERQQVISRATEAFDSLKLPATAPARLKLVHPEKRNAASDSERSDTSPLSLNPPITAASVTSAPSSSSASIPASKDDERKKPVTANGILSTGKVAKKRKADTPSSASPAPSHSEVAASDTERPLERLSKRADDKADKRSKQESSKTTTTERNASRLAVSQQRDRSTSRSRSQTFHSRKAPSVASSSGTSSSLEEAAAAAASNSHSGTSQRTSSMTSSSTDRSAVSTSTVATSVSSRSPRREKERPAKTAPVTTSTATPAVTTASKKSSIFESKRASPEKAKVGRPAATEAPASNKRKADALDLDKDAAPASGQSAKRAKTSDLFELARQYKSQYPEYQALHAQVYVQKVADESVKAKFVKMHNDMKTWKQLLWSESEGQQRSALANR